METYFAEIDQNGVVLRVIVATQEFIDSGALGDPANWVQTYADQGSKKNFAGIGHKYDKNLGIFVSPKPYPSWVLDEATAKWKAPKEQPIDTKDGKRIKEFVWSENKLDWEEVPNSKKVVKEEKVEDNGIV